MPCRERPTAGAARAVRMNLIDLKNRVAVITGGARGIGYAVAERMLSSGAAVSLWDVDAVRLEEAEDILSPLGEVSCLAVELTHEEEVQRAVGSTVERCGRLDILINNAGITGGNAPTWELEPSVWRQVLEINLVAPYLLSRAIVPHMIR